MNENEEKNIIEIAKVENQTQQEKVEKSQESNNKELSVIAMVLGLASILFLTKFLLSVTCGILAIIFGIKGKKMGGKDMAKVGFITGIIGLSIQAVFFLIGAMVGVFFVGLMGGLI